jgi:hypothetical protein
MSDAWPDSYEPPPLRGAGGGRHGSAPDQDWDRTAQYDPRGDGYDRPRGTDYDRQPGGRRNGDYAATRRARPPSRPADRGYDQPASAGYERSRDDAGYDDPRTQYYGPGELADDEGHGQPGRAGRRAGAGTRRAPGRRMGAMPTRFGVVVICAAAAVGGFLTVVTGGQPGLILSVPLLIGAAIGALAVRQRGSHVLLPVPALAYLVAAMAAGVSHDPSVLHSHTQLALGALQWLAAGFLAMIAATLLVAAIVVLRWWLGRRRSARAGEPSYRQPSPRSADRYIA